jgi:DUF4097 and DUF4098 domain-containing protein YvlB
MTDYQFETHQPVNLYVELGAGTVKVQADDEAAESHVSVSGRDAERVTVELEGDDLNVVAPKDRSGFLMGDRKLNITITVPTSSRLAVKTGSADVIARGRYSDTQVRSGSGDVVLDACEGAVLLETGSGDIRLGSAVGPLRVKSGSGDVVVDHTGDVVSISTGSGDVQLGASEGPVQVKTGSGDFEVADARTDVTMSTGSGDLVIGTANRGRVTAKGASGDVHVGIPAGVPVWTDVTTVSGRISSSLSGAGEPEEGADYVELRAKTVSGDIVLTEK